MSAAFAWVSLAAVLCLGISAGAMLTEAVVLVDYWRSLSAADFLAWFAKNEPGLTAFYGPLQTVSGVLVAATALLARKRAGAGLYLVATILAIFALALYPLYFRDVNASFVAATIAPERVPEALASWSRWQWLRTAVGVSAFAAALLADRRANAA